MGRFLNADAYTSTGQGILGNNMFAYCGGNPIVYSDDTGSRRDVCVICKDDGGSGNLKAKTKASSTVSLTTSVGVSVSIGVGPFTYGAQIALVTDSTGYSEVQATYYVPISSSSVSSTPTVSQMVNQIGAAERATNSVSFSVMGNISAYDAPSTSDLHEIGYQVGGSFGAGSAIAVDYNIIPNGTNQPYKGITISGGIGTFDLHGVMGITVPLFQCPISVFDVAEAANNAFWGIN